MMDEVEATQPFGSFFAFTELEDLPWVETSASSFRLAAESVEGAPKEALLQGAIAFEATGDVESCGGGGFISWIWIALPAGPIVILGSYFLNQNIVIMSWTNLEDKVVIITEARASVLPLPKASWRLEPK